MSIFKNSRPYSLPNYAPGDKGGVILFVSDVCLILSLLLIYRTKMDNNLTIKNDGMRGSIPSLFFMRDSNASVPRYGVYKPSLCMVVQEAMEVWLAD
ncbi:AraC family transcriptional regulator [Paenibacillus segetis]|uniref:AraC family transcriptional regulator n=1 Tax=Paenibacillus segetis TaxID=1325360 RepID=UPI001E4B9EA7|nr:AraC family transcriptional regulator [Paenibacillus segetis]